MPSPGSGQQASTAGSGAPAAFGRYQVVGRLGRGGQGVVYKAIDSDGNAVAVKALHIDWAWDARLRGRFAREVEAAQRVASFCTAGILDADLTAQPPYLVSEYVSGPSLRQEITERGPRTPGELHRLALGTVTALVAIHRAGVVHRDFKPDNVLLGPDGPRVIDFGVAHTGTGATLTEGETIGTPSYMAPEQADAGVVGAAADMFSWAEVMIYAATGSPPFGDDTPMAVVTRLLTDEPDVSALAEPLRGLCEQCLNRDPRLRPTAREALLGLLDGTPDDADTALDAGSRAAAPVSEPLRDPPVPAPRPTPGRPADSAETDPRGGGPTVVPSRSALGHRRRRRRRMLSAAAGIVVLACAAGLLGWHVYGNDGAGDHPTMAAGWRGAQAPPLAGTWRGVAHVPPGYVSAIGLRLKPGGRTGEVTDAARTCATGLRHHGGSRYALSRVGAMQTCLPGRRVTVTRRAAGGVTLGWTGGHVTLRRKRGTTAIPAAFRGNWTGTERVTNLRIRLTLPSHGAPKWRAAALGCTAGMRPWLATGHRLVLILHATPQCGGDDLIELTVDGSRLDYRSTFRTGTTQHAVLTRSA